MSETSQLPGAAAPSAPAATESKTPPQAGVIPQEGAPNTGGTPDPAKDPAREFAIISRKQKELFDREKQLKEQAAKYKDYEEMEALKDSNPLEYLRKKGVNLESLIIAAASEGEEPTVDQKLSKLEKLLADEQAARQKDKDDAEKAKAEAQKAAEQKFIDDYKKKIETDIKADLDKYECINAQNAYNLVYSVIEETWETTRTVMPIADAAEKVETYLLSEMQKLFNIKKLGISKAAEAKPEAPQKTNFPTLDSSVTPQSEPPSGKYLSEEESKREAAKLLRWN